MLGTTRSAPSAFEVLETLAATLGSGMPIGDACRVLARGGPISAQLARRLDDAARRTKSVARALGELGTISIEHEAVVAVAEENGKLAAGLLWAARAMQRRAARGRVLLAAITGPLLFVIIGLLLDPLPQMILGGGSWRSAIRPAIYTTIAIAVVILGAWKLSARPLRQLRALGPRLPFVGALFRLEAEADAAAIVGAFGDATTCGSAPAAAKVLLADEWSNALASVAADPTTPMLSFGEPFALALQAGIAARDLATRAARLADALDDALTARLRFWLRLVAFLLLAIIAAQSVHRLLTTPLPGLGGDLGNLPMGNTPEMKELERELENMLK